MSATSKDCAYWFLSGDPCPEPAYESSDYCILHIDLPDKDSPEYKAIRHAKETRTQEKIDAGDFTFEGAQLVEFSADRKDVSEANFGGATFSGDANFAGVTFSGGAVFYLATFSGLAGFWGATFRDNAWFNRATFSGVAMFDRATFSGDAKFDRATFLKEVDAFEATFDFPEAQEGLCRAAKQEWDKAGDRSKADYYFYREMEAKRKQKPRLWRWLELPAQYIFGYGVHPERLFIAFVIALVAFGIFYWPQGAPWVQGVPSSSPLNSFYFSFTTMLLPGSGLLNPQPGIAGVAVIVQALFGLLVWGTFIATLTRKFGR